MEEKQIVPIDVKTAERIIAFIIDLAIASALGVVPMLGWVLGPLFLITRDCLPFLNAQSPGKQLLKLKVIYPATGKSMRKKYIDGLKRNFMLLIPVVGILMEAFFIFTRNGMRLGDQLANTEVVSVDTEE